MSAGRHLVVLPLSAYGHMIPALLLADRLVRLGYEITYVCPQYRIKQLLQQCRARGCSEGIKFKTFKRSNPGCGKSELSGHDTAETLFSILLNYQEDAKEFKEIMKELLSCGGTPPSCIVSDAFVSVWAQDVADELKIPRIVMFPSPALALALVFHTRNLKEQGQLPVQVDSSQMIHIPGMESSGLSPIHPDESCVPGAGLIISSDAYNFFLENCLKIHNVVGVMCNTLAEIEEDACRAVRESRHLNPNKVPFAAIGPLLPDSYFQVSESQTAESGELVEDCLKWLDQQPPASVVYISLGSFGRATAEQVKEFALGLAASGKRFLWVLPGDGIESLPDGFLETAAMNRQGFVLQSWAPQLQVLSHRSTGGFLTHCGWNSTLESICQGVPMITMPFFSEQAGNAKLVVEHLRIGLKLLKDGGGLTQRDTIEAAVREAIENDEMRKRAAELKQVVRAAVKNAPMKTKAFIEELLEHYYNQNS